MSAQTLIILDYVSLLIMAFCTVIICYHVESFMQKMASYTSLLLLFTSIGFLYKTEAVDLVTLINGQRIVYCFIPHAIFAMVLFILAYCKYKTPKWFMLACSGVNTIISVLAFTIPNNQLFYVRYWAEEHNGHLALMKEYAFGHTFTMAVLIFYFIFSLAVAIKYTIENKRQGSRYLWRLIVVVLVPYTAYVVPKLTGEDNDMQPLAFAVFMLMVLYLIYRNSLYDVDNILARYSVETTEDAIVVFNRKDKFEGCNKSAELIFPQLRNISYDSDIRRALPIFNDILDGRITDYKQDDRIYAVSVKEIGNDQKVQGKAVWFEDVTLQRNYTDLLQKQKDSLEHEVVNLYDIGYKDQLTGLDNRRRYEEVIEEIRSSGNTKDLLIGLFDVNGLKKTNDTIGHAAGDELIKGAADIIHDVFGEDGMVFRIGGDEFFVVIREPERSLKQYIGALNAAMKKWKGKKIDTISVSYGFVQANETPDLNIDELSISADRAMYDHKQKYYEQQNQ